MQNYFGVLIMIVKYNTKITNYNYVLSFDIAKRLTGYSLLDIKEDKIVEAGTIDTTHADCMIWQYFYDELNTIFNHIKKTYSGEFFVTKEKLPNQNGRFSTIETLQGLAQAHAIFDLACATSNVDVYDYDGVHSVSVKAYFKELTNIDKPQKEDIAKYIEIRYSDFNLDSFPLDVTDSIAVTITLIGKKYNNDILSEIKNKKKELKAAKSENKKNKIKNEIESLIELKL